MLCLNCEEFRILIIENSKLHFIEAKLESGNSKEQVENLLLLRDLYDASKKTWACIDSFKDIDGVYLYYLKRNKTPLQINNQRVRNEITILSWSEIFDSIKNEGMCKRLNICDHIKYLGY